MTAGAVLAPPARPATTTVPLERVDDFGANPGAPGMYAYRRADLPARAPVVLALHGCAQSAQLRRPTPACPNSPNVTAS